MEEGRGEYIYTTNFLSLGEIFLLIKLLRKSRNTKLQMKISSHNAEFIRYIKQFFRQNQKGTKNVVLSKAYHSKTLMSHKIAGFTVQKIIAFENYLSLMSFVKQFKPQLEKLGKQYNVSFEIDMEHLKVLSTHQISSVFLAQILLLKRGFVYRWFKNYELWMKTKYSLTMKNDLKQNQIYAIPRHQQGYVFVHGRGSNFDRLEKFMSKFLYDAVYIPLKDDDQANSVNRCLFELLIQSIHALATRIRFFYEIPFEINHKNMIIIIHSRNPIFSEKPLEQITQFFDKIIIIGYSSDNPDEENQLFSKLKLKDKKCLSHDILIGTLYQCWNKSKLILPQEVYQAYSPMISQIKSPNFRLRIHIKQGNLKTKRIMLILELVEKYKLQCQNYAQVVDNNTKVIEVKLKNVSQLQKQRLSNFLEELIAGKVNQQIKKAEIEEEDNCCELLEVDSPVESQNQARQTAEESTKLKKLFIKKMAQELKIEQIGKRNNQIEQFLYYNYYIKCRVKNVYTQQSLQAIKAKSSEQELIFLPVLCQQNSKQLDSLRIEDIKTGSSFYFALFLQRAHIFYCVEVIKRL